MLVTTNWINDYLQTPVSAKEQAKLLTAAGFPLEGREDLPDGDVRQDFEMTSNRGDCTCHIGLAREIAARTDNTLCTPSSDLEESGPLVNELASVDNQEPELCPLYTAKIILGTKVADSPDWLRTRIKNRGDIPRNNIVDATNFILFEQGQPTHVFDLDKLSGKKIIVRRAKDGEVFLPLGEDATELKLTTDDLVIADGEKPVALAGVKGGALASVTNETTNILIESATFDPVVVREMSRRHKITSDSSFRFERGVNPRQVEPYSDRLASVLIDVGGGTLCQGTLSSGQPLPEKITTTMRTQYCRERLGIELTNEQMVNCLNNIGIEATCTDDLISATIPCFRGDIHREIDLVEEVGRIYGYEEIQIEDTLEVRVPDVGGESAARQAVLNELAGMGFIECVTHSLISTDAANHFLLDEETPLTIDDDRAAAEPALRPSLIPSLLTVRKHNEDNGVKRVNLAELGSIFSLKNGEHHEITELALMIDSSEENGIAELRGAINRIAQLLAGNKTVSVVEDSSASWLEPGGNVVIDGNLAGRIGRLNKTIQEAWDIPNTLHVAQLYLSDLFAAYPPDVQSHALPTQPAIDRDISIIVEENVSWASIKETICNLSLDYIESINFVTTFRGTNIEVGKKSLTLRLRFRDDDRTLTHEEVNAPCTLATNALIENIHAEIRS